MSALVAALLATGATATAQTRPIAWTNARIHTVSGEVIESGTLVIKNGKVEAVGKDVTVPAGAKVVDARGKTIMPGLVSAWSQAGMQRQNRSSTRFPTRGGRRFSRSFRSSSSSRAANKAATKVVDALYARQPIFHDLLEVGVTTLALNPTGSGFPGLGAVLNPKGETLRDLTLDDDAFVQIGMQRNTAAKKVLKETFEKARKVVEEREKPPEPKKPEKKEEAKKPDAKPAGKDGGKEPPKKDEPKPTPKPEPKPDPKPTPKPAPEKKQDPQKKPDEKKAPPKKPKDPNLEVLADLLQGKRRAIVQIDSAADMLHWRTVVDDEVEFPRVLLVSRHDTNSGTIDLVLDHVKKWDCSVMLPASLSTLPRTQHLIHPARMLHDAGVEIGFVVGDSTYEVRNLFFQLMELVRSGLPADVAIKAITQVPAKALGVSGRTGSLDAGKDADLLVFDGDPLSPTGKLEQVWLRGERVER